MTTPPQQPQSTRERWFGSFGYTGHEEAIGLQGGGSASPDAIWAVYQGLRALNEANLRLFLRTAVAAVDDRLPSDPEHLLYDAEFGSLVAGRGTNRDWAEGRRALVLSLLEVDIEEFTAVFAPQPFVAAPSVLEAA